MDPWYGECDDRLAEQLVAGNSANNTLSYAAKYQQLVKRNVRYDDIAGRKTIPSIICDQQYQLQ